MKLAATIITYNEERNIARCLNSLNGVANEILVVDSFSTDRTSDICKSAGVNFIQHPFEGHIQQKNYTLDQVGSEWIISLDADEALSEELRKNILAITTDPGVSGYTMNRLTNYCGHWVRHCGWYPDTKLRLVRNKSAHWTGVNPHDRMELTDGKSVVHLAGDILHYSYYTREDHLKQIEYFSSIAAKELFTRNYKSSWLLILIKVLAQFIKSFIIKTGFLDGTTGFTISKLSAYATYRKYYKLKLLQRGKKI
jgi:glycosyltransferase involved in cell wall biosynthesis